MKIGILLNENQYQQEILFKWSIEEINHRGILNKTKLIGSIKRTKPGDSWDAEKKACELIEDSAIILIGPSNFQTSEHVASICDALDIPHFNLITKEVSFIAQPTSKIITSSPYQKISEQPMIETISQSSSVSVDLSVSHTILTKAYLDVLHALNWKNFVYLYEQDDSLYHLQEHFNGKSLKSHDINMKILRFNPTKPYRNTFWLLKSSNIRHIMLDVKCSNLKSVLKHAQQVSMMTEAHSYLVVCLDTQTIDLEDFKHSRSRIVWLSMFDQFSDSFQALQLSLQDNYDYDNHNNNNNNNPVSSRIFYDSGISPNLFKQIKIEGALIHDSINTIAHTLKGIDSIQYIDSIQAASCKRSIPWPHGSTTVNYLKTLELIGMTGPIKFDTSTSGGQRSDYKLNLMRLTEDGYKTIGNWSNYNQNFSLQIEKNELQYLQKGDPALYESDQRDLLIVTSIRNEPYFMNKQTTKIETGNGRYEGYAIDLIDELSRLVGFDYMFKEVDDGKYGKFDEEKKEWNGMIREVMIGKADLAIADLSITSSREDAVDFTLPFMSTGISILFKKPTTKELELFSFLSPFENHVWVYVCGAYIGVSSLLFIVARISPYEWADPHPCRQEDKILRNQFSVTNSFWFTIAAVMQQGSDLAPRSLSTRLVAAIWYFFTLIMISSYTANLAAFLTVEKVVYPIEKAEELYRHPQHIKYGCVESGSTGAFFQHSKPASTFKKMYRDMVFMQSNEQGKAEVEKGNYAFFMESTSIEYTIERNCNLTQIGGLLDSKGYGIALAKNSTRKRDYRTKLSEAILSLQESGKLEVLKNRWWKEKHGGGACDIDDGQGGDVKELTLANVGGVFVVLGMGITISFILCGLELYVKSCRLARAQGTTKWIQLKRRIEFALSLSDNY